MKKIITTVGTSMLTNDLNDIGEYFKDIKDKFSDEWENENRSIENIRKVILKRLK